MNFKTKEEYTELTRREHEYTFWKKASDVQSSRLRRLCLMLEPEWFNHQHTYILEDTFISCFSKTPQERYFAYLAACERRLVMEEPT